MYEQPMIWGLISAGVAITFLVAGIRIVGRERAGHIERLGKYFRYIIPGFRWIIPFVNKIYEFNTAGQFAEANPRKRDLKHDRQILTDAQAYYKIKAEQEKAINTDYKRI